MDVQTKSPIRERALDALVKGEKIKLGVHEAFIVHGAAFLEDGKAQEAHALLKAAEAWDPDHAELQMMLAASSSTLGDRDAVVRHAQRALELNVPRPWGALHMLAEAAPEQVDLQTLDQVSRTPGLPDEAVCALLHSMALVQDAQHNYEQAFLAYQQANKQRILQDGEWDLGFSPDRPSKPLWVAENVNWPELARLAAPFRQERPEDSHVKRIFIFGMPRSGTTLIEQALLSAEGSFSVGEDRGMAALFEKIEAYGPKTMVRAGQEYDEHALAWAKYQYDRGWYSTSRPVSVISKSTVNFAFAGLAHLLWGDDVVFVDVRRDPRAAITSAWCQNFAEGVLNWSCDFGTAVDYYEHYCKIRDAYQVQLDSAGARWVTVHYEDLVNEWHSGACCDLFEQVYDRPPNSEELSGLRFPDQASRGRAVNTASVYQVRKPVSPRAVDKWRRFEPWLPDRLLKLGD